MVIIKTVLIMMMNGSRTSMEGCQGGDEGVLSIVINDPKLFLEEPLFFFKSNKKVTLPKKQRVSKIFKKRLQIITFFKKAKI